MYSGEQYLRRRREQKVHSTTTSEWEWEPGDEAEQFPILASMLAKRRIDKELRQLATLIIFCEGGQLKFLVNDKDAGYTGFGCLDGLETALHEIEAQMASEKLDWREQRRK